MRIRVEGRINGGGYGEVAGVVEQRLSKYGTGR